jgi:hypothetical protein
MGHVNAVADGARLPLDLAPDRLDPPYAGSLRAFDAHCPDHQLTVPVGVVK